MGKVGGHRNFGFGKQMAWAGTQALRDRYGDGHYATVAAHTARWGQFAEWVKAAEGIRDAREVTVETVVAYGEELAGEVSRGTMAVAYAQNLLSSVNVVLEALRGDRLVRISPAGLVGARSHVRECAPTGLDRAAVHECAGSLRAGGHDRIAAVVELARDLGLRVREASMLDAKSALREAVTRGAINVTTGTKGGRGHQVDRWVPVSERTLGSLRRAAAAQGTDRNLIPGDQIWRQWNDHLHHVWAEAREAHGLGTLHDLRAAYACERYEALTGHPAPAVAGQRGTGKPVDRAARETIAQQLGHTRTEVAAAYIGRAR
jgi:hypothetical protein